MAYDATLLATIDAAISSLVAGTRIVTFTMGDKTMQYGQTNLGELKLLRSDVADALRSVANAPKFILTNTSKGL